jgi:hypothetical protein
MAERVMRCRVVRIGPWVGAAAYGVAGLVAGVFFMPYAAFYRLPAGGPLQVSVSWYTLLPVALWGVGGAIMGPIIVIVLNIGLRVVGPLPIMVRKEVVRNGSERQ